MNGSKFFERAYYSPIALNIRPSVGIFQFSVVAVDQSDEYGESTPAISVIGKHGEFYISNSDELFRSLDCSIGCQWWIESFVWLIDWLIGVVFSELTDLASASHSTGLIVSVVLLILACPVVFLLVRRYRQRRRANSSFTTRFQNTPYGAEFHDCKCRQKVPPKPVTRIFFDCDCLRHVFIFKTVDMEEEDMPVFRAFADDEPLVNTWRRMHMRTNLPRDFSSYS